MAKMRRSVSDRAVKLVSSARLSYFCEQNNTVSSNDPSLESPRSVLSSPAPNSPIPSWWDNIFEATDIHKLQLRSSSNATVVKRKLFLSPDKRAAEIPLGCHCSKDGLSSPLPQGDSAVCLHSSNENEPLSYVGCQNHDNSTKDTFEEGPAEIPVGSHRSDNGLSSPLPLGDSALTVRPSHENEPVSFVGCQNDGHSTKDIFRKEQERILPEDVSNINHEFKNITNPCIEEYFSLPSMPDSQDSAIQEDVEKNLYPSHLKIYKSKLALNSGMEHVTSKGKVRPARSIKPPCHEKCARCLSPKLTIQERLKMNREFWNLKDHRKQWEFIYNSLIISAPRRKFAVEGAKGEKHVSRVYTFLIEGKSRKVCKTMFKNTLCVCDSWIDSAIAHCCGSSEVLEDKRGKHNNRSIRGLGKSM